MTPTPRTATSSADANSDYVNQWIAARAGVGSDPAACAPFPTGMTCLQPPNDF